MMFPNNNKAIVRKLTYRTLKAGKLRNVMAILAIVLTTTLFTSLFTIVMSMLETIQQETMRQAGGSAHGSFKYLTDEEFTRLKGHPLIKEIEYSVMLGMTDNDQLQKHHTEIRYATDGDARMCFSFPTTGRMPESENEVATDTAVLDLLKVPHQIGHKLTIYYSIDGKKSSKEFVLSGFWKNDEISRASYVYVSKPFISKVLAGMKRTPQKTGIGAGMIFADVMFQNSWDIENKMKAVIRDSGYTADETSPGSVPYGVNWAYLTTNVRLDMTSVILILCVSALIIFTGYLIIYSIFQISVVRDIRFYGLLKAVGTTSGQIKKIIRNQALLLSAAGIPLGLVAGFLTGIVLLPLIMSVSTSQSTYISFSPLIFAGSAFFSLITVWLGFRKPGKTAGGVSPIEAVRYTDQGAISKRQIKKSSTGNKIHRMALSNLSRNKRKTVLTVISMSLSLILLNSVYTVTGGFDMNKFLNRFLTTDFVIGHANYFNNNLFLNEKDEVSQRMINALSKQKGMEGGGKIYYNIRGASVSFKNTLKALQLYGLEDFPLSQMEIVEGELEPEKFKEGKYIIEGVQPDDNGKVDLKTTHYAIGDKVTVKLTDGTANEYKVMAKARVERGLSVRYGIYNAVEMYLPADEFVRTVKRPVAMNYVLNVGNGYIDAVESFLQKYTKSIEPAMDYESKKGFVNEFKMMQDMFLTVGGVLSLIIGMIGILNFINLTLTGIITRRREFAMLQSIGMTGRQLTRLLVLEGLFYAVYTIAIIFTVGTLFSFTVIRTAVGGLWFFSYHFTLLPLLLSAPVLILISAAIPYAAYFGTNRQTIVERLRETE